METKKHTDKRNEELAEQAEQQVRVPTTSDLGYKGFEIDDDEFRRVFAELVRADEREQAPAAPVQEPEHLQQGVDALVSAAGTALEVLEKHRQMKGEAPMGMLGVRAMEELKKAFRLLYPQDDYEPPAAPVPLTDEQINKLRQQYGVTSDGRGIKEFTYVVDFARAIEAAHGITKGGARPEDQRPV